MKTIKFRAWDKKLKKMLPDTDFGIYNGTSYPIEMIWEMNEWWEKAKKEYGNRLSFETTVDRFMANFITSDWALMDFANYKGIDDYVVMQFTGLTDKNGVEIYEGDVVHDEMYTYKIYWDDEDCGSRMEANGDGEILYLSDYEPSSLIIYGNIHENPELIK